MSMDCNKTKEQLEELFEQIVERPPALRNSNDLVLPALSLAHLSQCEDCRAYQSANLILMEASSAMPLLTVPDSEGLTKGIMAAVMTEKNESPQLTGNNSRDLLLLVAAFTAFAAMSAYGSNLAESILSSISWLISLVAILALKPLIENNREAASL